MKTFPCFRLLHIFRNGHNLLSTAHWSAALVNLNFALKRWLYRVKESHKEISAFQQIGSIFIFEMSPSEGFVEICCKSLKLPGLIRESSESQRLGYLSYFFCRMTSPICSTSPSFKKDKSYLSYFSSRLTSPISSTSSSYPTSPIKGRLSSPSSLFFGNLPNGLWPPLIFGKLNFLDWK